MCLTRGVGRGPRYSPQWTVDSSVLSLVIKVQIRNRMKWNSVRQERRQREDRDTLNKELAEQN